MEEREIPEVPELNKVMMESTFQQMTLYIEQSRTLEKGSPALALGLIHTRHLGKCVPEQLDE